ncbi:MAG: nucleotidyl transferase AbiEii/AbiGii toxin family protein [Planctomycetota bacterium]
MHDAIRSMLNRYDCQTRDDYVNALREILQKVALLGLWRGKFFEHAALYGGTALRVLYGLDRYSEDLDFSLLRPGATFDLGVFGEALLREIRSFGFEVEFQHSEKRTRTGIECAFLKANTYRQLLVIDTSDELLRGLPTGKVLKTKLEVDTDPPGGFGTEGKYLLQPIPFGVRVYRLPDLFAGKLHAVLCRKWQSRVKGRDWYDLVWYAARHPHVNLGHLETRMRQSDDYADEQPLTHSRLLELLRQRILQVDVAELQEEVAPFVRDPQSLELWSREFFLQVIEKLEESG